MKPWTGTSIAKRNFPSCCRRCLLTPYNEISMWKNAIIPHMEAQYKTSIWKNAITGICTSKKHGTSKHT